jgi:Xaa-Pro aminopeptidase
MNTVPTADAEGTDAGRLGHGLGVSLSEWPSLIPTDHTVLAPGMVLALESEFSAYFSDRAYPIHVSRIPSGIEVTTDILAEMETALPAVAGLLPSARPYRVVGYGCTSASSVIGSDRVA